MLYLYIVASGLRTNGQYMPHIQPLNGVGGSLSPIDATNLQTLTGLGHSAFATRLTWLLLLLFEIPSGILYW